jgi:hypothetical protein
MPFSFVRRGVRRVGSLIVPLVVVSSLAASAGHADLTALPPTWVVHEAGTTNHSENPKQVVVGVDGSITVLGSGYLPATAEDVLVIRYAANGQLQWTRRFASPGHVSDLPGAIVAAPDGGVWFSALHNETEQRTSVTRLDALGEVSWTTSRSVTSANGVFQFQLVPQIAVDVAHGAPRIYVAVSDAGAYRVMRLDDAGAVAWETTWTGSPTVGGVPAGVAVGPSGSVFVTGTVVNIFTTQGAYGTIGVSPLGDLLWSHLGTGALGNILAAPFIAAHPSGGAIVAGSPETVCGTHDVRVWSIGEDGVERWMFSTQSQDPCALTSAPTALAVAPNGRIAVGSPMIIPVGWQTVLLQADGTEAWTRLWLNPVSAGEPPQAIAFDRQGGVVVAGARQPQPTADAFGIIRYDATGAPSWFWTAVNPASGAAVSLAVGTDGACFTTATSWGGPAVGERISTMRFDPPGVPCPADLDGSGAVDGADLGALLASWGACAGCAADLTGDGAVNGADLGALLAGWGACQ